MNDKRSLSDFVPPGYKRTEVGVIPEDWDVDIIGNLARITTGAKNTQDGTPESLYPFFVRSQEVERINSYSFDCEAVLTAGDGVGTGKVFHYIDGKFDVHQRVYCICNFSSLLHGRYFFYQFSSRFFDRVMSMTAKSSVDSVRMEMIANMPIPLPPLPEQQAIARALADADAWIEALDRLIAKKRAIKQAAMGDLLTGRVRLPGFGAGVRMKRTEIGEIPRDWKTKSFGELFSFLTTSSCSRADLDENGDVFYIHYGDIHTQWNYVLDFSKARVPKISAVKVQNATPLQNGDLILVDASEDEEGVGKGVVVKNVGDQYAVAGLHTLALRSKTSELADGFKAYIQAMQPVRSQIRRIATGLKVFGISKTNLAEVLIPLPSHKEQQAIAQTLSDMDAEIEALERERDKARAIKQGMMQELLTGRIRLVERTPVTQSDQIVRKSKGRNEAFREAVLLSVITLRFSNKRYPIGRFRRTKLVYLLRRHIQAGVADYLKQAAGPYRPKTKYGYAEKIARRRQYVQTHQCEDRKGFIPGPRVREAEHYFEKWYGREPLQWMEQFRYRKNEDLELLTTVDMAMGELQAAGKPVHVAGIKTLIAESEIWRAKLERPIFSDIKIARAMREIRQFFPDR